MHEVLVGDGGRGFPGRKHLVVRAFHEPLLQLDYVRHAWVLLRLQPMPVVKLELNQAHVWTIDHCFQMCSARHVDEVHAH